MGALRGITGTNDTEVSASSERIYGLKSVVYIQSLVKSICRYRKGETDWYRNLRSRTKHQDRDIGRTAKGL